jgi:hypothetical protein
VIHAGLSDARRRGGDPGRSFQSEGVPTLYLALSATTPVKEANQVSPTGSIPACSVPTKLIATTLPI